MDIQILPATGERFDDAEHALTGGGDGASCQCQWWTLTNAEFQKTSTNERAELLRSQVEASPAPALIAYVDDHPAGWVRIGPRTDQTRILRTRMIAANTREPAEDPTVWAVSCFVVRKEHRGAGLNSTLLDAAITHAKEQGARVIEAYPVDPSGGTGTTDTTDTTGTAGTPRKSANELYHGVLSTFERAGFDLVAHPSPTRAVVSLTLRD